MDFTEYEFLSKNFPKLKSYTKKEVQRQLKFVEQVFGIPFPLKLKIRKNGVKCWGGTCWNSNRTEVIPKINVVLGCFISLEDEMFCNEYDEIASDIDIGEFVGHWKKVVASYICHEMAHAVDLYLEYYKLRGKRFLFLKKYEMYRKSYKIEEFGHGMFWQTLYCLLRATFVNNDFIPVDFDEEVPCKKRNWKFSSIEVHHRGKDVILYKKKEELIGVLVRNNQTWSLYDGYSNYVGEYSKAVDGRNYLLAA